MKLRVVAGGRPAGLTPSGMKTLYQSARLLVEGSRDVLTISDGSGNQAFLVGAVVGRREGAGSLARIDGGELARLIFGSGPDRWREVLEGRYGVVRLAAADSCSIAADRFGQKDFFIQDGDGHTVIATDLSLLPVADTGGAYDQVALAHTLSVYGYRPPKRHTLFQAVRRLDVDQWIHVDGGRASLRECVFRPTVTATYGARELDRYAETLLDAVRARGSRHGNVVYLSSGWDSTALLACLVNLFGAAKVRAVIGRMQYAERSGVINQFEIERARAIADYFGVRLDIVELDYRTRGLERVERLSPVLRSHQVVSLTALNFALLAEHVARTTNGEEVVFAGEISDGAHNLGFSQFTTIFHPVLEFREYSDKMASYLFGPTFLRLFLSGEFVSDPVYQLLRGRCGFALFDDAAPDEVARRKQLLASFFLRAQRVPLWSLRNNRLLTAAGRDAYSREMEVAYLDRPAEDLSPETLYAWYLHLYNSFHWQGSTVVAIWLTAEAHGLRTALPFWDSRIQDFLAAMPESWGRGLDLNPTKYPLKWMLTHRIDYPMHLQVGPHSYLYDVDPSFSHGAEILYGSAFSSYFSSLLRKRRYETVLSPEVFDLGYVDAVVRRYLDGTEVRGAEMNDLLSLCLLSMVRWHGDVKTG